ncbi:MAG TPA: hypothetical protein VIM70_00090 [Clostridium sp.]|uniref:hypothetical protein n=1 Tax=Clostridium sp. TaxID=1506 RepID=UPI002F953A17
MVFFLLFLCDKSICKTNTLTFKGKQILKKDIKRRIAMVRYGEEALKLQIKRFNILV